MAQVQADRDGSLAAELVLSCAGSATKGSFPLGPCLGFSCLSFRHCGTCVEGKGGRRSSLDENIDLFLKITFFPIPSFIVVDIIMTCSAELP